MIMKSTGVVHNSICLEWSVYMMYKQKNRNTKIHMICSNDNIVLEAGKKNEIINPKTRMKIRTGEYALPNPIFSLNLTI
ncbi:hypothetical protein AC249_AIPGENE20864 [Exaiptasia diaphana]|nr:hypothetical protein AC249_AIPGENE20864 [Exaiptasia diaphana]